jgi:hypothetical protein
MGVPRTRMFAVSLLLACLVGSAGYTWRLAAQNGPPPNAPLQKLPARIPPPPATAADRGTTYHSLESDARRVTTRFADGIAVAERGADGTLSTHLTDLAGNDAADVRVHHVDFQSDSLEITVPGHDALHAARRAGLRPTLGWTNQQAYSVWKDGDAFDATPLEWQDTLMRPAGSRKRDVAGDVTQTDTEWRGGLTATVTKKIGTHISYVTDRTTSGPVFISRLKQDGVEVGSAQWWPQEQTFAWSFTGLSEGWVDAARIQKSGGWPFAFDMDWVTVQTFALYRFHSLLKSGGSVSERRREGWLERIENAFAPTLFANDPGCDNLHWLDQSILRPCCDTHDLCYSKPDPNCTWSSWWMWWSSWQCDQCNIAVVFCFFTAGGRGFYPAP